MKKILIAILLLSSSCTSTIYYNLGQSEYDFLQANKHKGLQIEEQSYSRTVYKACNNYGYNCLFFYFRDNKLYQYDRGVAEPNIRITY